MRVNGGFLFGAAGRRSALVEEIDHVIVRLIQLRLGKVGQQTTIAAVAVDDQYFLAAVASHLVRGCLKQCQLQIATISDGAGLVTGLGDLAKIILREDHSVLLLCRMQCRVTRIEQIGANRHVWPMLLENAEWQQARALRTLDRLEEVWS